MPGTHDFPRAVMVLVVGDHELPLAVVDAGAQCDLALVDEILRVQLVVARRGWSIRLTQIDDELRELIELVGLGEHLGL